MVLGRREDRTWLEMPYVARVARVARRAPMQRRPEITSTMQTYIDLHRHAAVRASLLGFPGIELRLMVAHAIVGSHLWLIMPEPQTSRNEDARDNLDNAPAEAVFDERRRAVLGPLGFLDEEPTVIGGSGE
jgi:ParB family chromosome partitioning protein